MLQLVPKWDWHLWEVIATYHLVFLAVIFHIWLFWYVFLRNFRFIKNENVSEHLQKQPLEVFCKRGVLNNLAMSTGKNLCWSLLLIILHAFIPTTLLKRDSNTGVFPKILWKFYKHLFWRSSANACFCIYTTCYSIWPDLVAIIQVLR